jgi:hypothetical protein
VYLIGPDDSVALPLELNCEGFLIRHRFGGDTYSLPDGSAASEKLDKIAAARPLERVLL